jgi:hypothetical protein
MFYFLGLLTIGGILMLCGIQFLVVRHYPIRYPYFLPIFYNKGIGIESTNERWNTEFLEINRGLKDAESFLFEKGFL